MAELLNLLRQLQWCSVYDSANEKLDEEKARHASLAQHNGFGLAFLHSLLRQLNAQQSRTHVVDWSRWTAISSLPHICSPSFSFKGKVEKKQTPTNALPPFPCFEAIQLDELSRCPT